MKKLISMLLVIALVLSFAPVVHAETYNGAFGLGINWTLDTATGVLTVEGSGEMKDFESSSSSLYKYRSYVKTVIIKPGITHIGDYTFQLCENITSVTIPEGVTSIGNYSFRHLKALTSITLPSTLTSIGSGAFSCCGNLQSIVIPENVVSIGDHAFESCTSLQSVKMYDGLQTIGKSAFYSCRSVGYIRVPDTVTSVGERAFQDCRSMTHIVLSDSMTEIPSYLFISCTELNSIVIGENVKSIGVSALSGLKNLKDIVLPESLETISSAAFSNCGIEDLILPASVTSVAPTAFSDCKNLKKIAVLNPNCLMRTNYLGDKTALGVAGTTVIYGHNSTYSGSGNYVTAMEYADEFGFAFQFITDSNLWEDHNPGYNPFTDVPSSQYYYDPVLWAYDTNVTAGATSTTFEPSGNCKRGQVVTFLWRALNGTDPTGSCPFTDVPTTEYYYDPILWAYEEGITVGTSATTFSPEATVTRGQFVTFLWRAAGEPEPTAKSTFSDVPSGEYYYKAVCWAVENGITQGTGNGQFSPNDTCLREHVVTFLYRFLAD